MLVDFLFFLKYIFLTAIVLILGIMAFIMMSFRNVVPFVPTPKRIVSKMVKLAEIKKGERICDLGSGTGRISMEVAKQHKHNLIMGVEKSFTLRLVNKLILLFHPFLRRRIQIINKDFFNLDLRNFDVIICFITPEGLRRLIPKFKMLQKGSRIVSYMFPFDDCQGFVEKIEHVTSKDSIYLYIKV